MKKVLLIFILSMFVINLTSAYYYGGGFSLSDLLNEVDSSTMTLGAIFIISFALINFALAKFFKDNKQIAGVVSFAVSLWMTYEINRQGFDIETLFYDLGYNIGFSYDILSTILPLVLIGGAIYLIIKLKTNALFVLGGVLIAVSFTEIIYEKGITLIIGIALILIGAYFKSKNKGTNLNKLKKKLTDKEYGKAFESFLKRFE